jgi:hypothetical protein
MDAVPSGRNPGGCSAFWPGDQIRGAAITSSDQHVRAALADALSHFPAWHDDLARLEVRTARGVPVREKPAMADRCGAIAREIAEVRTDIVLVLADTPRDIAGHSRVVDIEKAFDNLETKLAGVRKQLGVAV